MKPTSRQRLEWSVRALAQPADVQLSLFPEFVCTADELALEFDQWRRAVADAGQDSLTPQTWSAIEALDARIAAMSGPGREHLWTDESLEHGDDWTAIRKLALTVIRAARWSSSPPPPDRDVYVAGPDP